MPTIRSLTLTTIALLGVTSASLAAPATPPTTLRPGQRLTPAAPAPPPSHRSAPAASQTERSSSQAHRQNSDHAFAQRLARIEALRADAARSGNHAVLAELDLIFDQLVAEYTASTRRATAPAAPTTPGTPGTTATPSNSFSFATDAGRRETPVKPHRLFETERDGVTLAISDEDAPFTRRVVEKTIAAPLTGGGANGPSTHATTDDPNAVPTSDRRTPPGVRPAPGSGSFAHTSATAAAQPAAPSATRRGTIVTPPAHATGTSRTAAASRGNVDQRLEQLARSLRTTRR